MQSRLIQKTKSNLWLTELLCIEIEYNRVQKYVKHRSLMKTYPNLKQMIARFETLQIKEKRRVPS